MLMEVVGSVLWAVCCRDAWFGPLPIWPCMREDGGRPEPTLSLRLPWACRPWLGPLWASAPGPRLMFWLGGAGSKDCMFWLESAIVAR